MPKRQTIYRKMPNGNYKKIGTRPCAEEDLVPKKRRKIVKVKDAEKLPT